MMSIAQLTHRGSVGTKRVTNHVPDVSKRPQRAQRTQISHIYDHVDTDNLIDEQRSSTIVPMDTAAMSVEILNQYNNLIEAEESLAFKPLPPVKISYHSTKNKFQESNRGDTSSRIIRPHLSVKTHSPGHHIFTEGISKKSLVRSPTFALQKVGVPYSNLPDNISIHKEKDKFAFGVKREDYEKSPYRLTPKPFKTGSAVFITRIDSDKSSVVSNDKFLKAKTGGARANVQRPSLEIKSNVIKLKPLVNMDKDGKTEFGPEYIKVPSLSLGPSKPPLVPRNSIHRIDSGEMKMTGKNETNHKPHSTVDQPEWVRDRKLSVVSIGENIDPNFYGNTKRETRQLYPMYDHKSRMNEHYKRQYFEYSDPDSFHSRPKLPASTFTYKVSTRAMSFIQDNSPDRFKPIKNNLSDSQGNLIHKQRGYRTTSSLDDVSKLNSDYNFRKYYRRVFRRPKSSDTLSSDVSQIPGNPPPSEISHIFSEDGPIVINDIRNEMLPLVEERTMTASMISPMKDISPHMMNRLDQLETPPNTKQGDENEGFETIRSQRTYLEEIQTCTDTDIQIENALQAVESSNCVETGMSVNVSSLDTARIPITEADSIHSPFQPNSPIQTTIENKDNDITTNNTTVNSIDLEQIEDMDKFSKCANSVHENSAKNEASVLEYIAEAELRVKEHTLSAGSEAVEIEVLNQSKSDNTNEQENINKDTKRTHLPKIKAASSKHLLSVPKLSLDSAAHHPALDMRKERTSLSRTLQSLTCAENKQQSQSVKNSEKYSLKLDIEKSGEVSLKRTHVPVTRLRLFSNNSSIDVENDTLYESLGIQVNIGVTSRSADQNQSEKKLVNNANVSFIYPSNGEIKAKRQ